MKYTADYKAHRDPHGLRILYSGDDIEAARAALVAELESRTGEAFIIRNQSNLYYAMAAEVFRTASSPTYITLGDITYRLFGE